MKKIHIYFYMLAIASTLFASSCKKDETPTPAVPKKSTPKEAIIPKTGDKKKKYTIS